MPTSVSTSIEGWHGGPRRVYGGQSPQTERKTSVER